MAFFAVFFSFWTIVDSRERRFEGALYYDDALSRRFPPPSSKTHRGLKRKKKGEKKEDKIRTRVREVSSVEARGEAESE